MGCDIHGPFLFGKSEYGAMFQAQFDWSRDYTLFTLLANVRNDGDLVAIAEPRGYGEDWLGRFTYKMGLGMPDPDPDCEGNHEYHGENTDCHSASWLTTEELIEVQRRYVAAEHQPEPDVGRVITFMRSLEYDAAKRGISIELRLVFCFDN